MRLKTLASASLVACVIVIFMATTLSAESYYRFAVTKRKYSCHANMESKAVAEFGPGAKVADWNTIKALFSQDIAGFCDAVGLVHAWCKVGKRSWWGGWRHYFVQRFNGNVPSTWLVHDQIGDNTLCLGSWCDEWNANILVDLENIKLNPCFKYAMEDPVVGEEITFDASCSFDVEDSLLTFVWAFGDDQISEGKLVSHSYKNRGKYKVSLLVTRPDGVTATAEQYVEVKWPKVILLHGLWDTAEKCWQDKGVTEFLSQNGFAFYLDNFCPNNDSIRNNASKVAEWISGNSRPGGKVNILAHSMGGLNARYYLADQTLWPKDKDGNPEHRVGKLITLGTPHWGTDVHLLHPIAANLVEYDNWNCKDNCLNKHLYLDYPEYNFKTWSPALRDMTAAWLIPSMWGQKSPMTGIVPGVGEPAVPGIVAEYIDMTPLEWVELEAVFPNASSETLYENHANYYNEMISKLTVPFSGPGVFSGKQVSPLLNHLNAIPLPKGIDYYFIYGVKPDVVYYLFCEYPTKLPNLLKAEYGDGSVPPYSGSGRGLTFETPRGIVQRRSLPSVHVDLPKDGKDRILKCLKAPHS